MKKINNPFANQARERVLDSIGRFRERRKLDNIQKEYLNDLEKAILNCQDEELFVEAALNPTFPTFQELLNVKSVSERKKEVKQ